MKSSRFTAPTTAASAALIALALAAPSLRPALSAAAADSYFLSQANPLATTDQRDVEAEAIRIMRMPAAIAGKQKAAARWRTVVGNDPSPEAWTLFDQFVDEYAFNYVLKAVDGDPNYPKIVRLHQMGHDWMGMQVPGSRNGGGENPDNSYTIIPVAYGAHYELTGQRRDPAPVDSTYTLTPDLLLGNGVALLDGRDIKAGPDGKFVITMGPEPANGRANYMQTKPDVRYLFIRYSRSDWRQVPPAMRVRRLDPPTAPPMTEQQIAERAALFMVDDVPQLYWWLRVNAVLPPNLMSKPVETGSIGGLVSQATSFGRFHLADDDAAIITVRPAGALYSSLILYNYWYQTVEYAHHTSSLTDAQSVPNADGTYTYVVSEKDPGVRNWLDPAGLHDLLVVRRWQGLPDRRTDVPAIRTKLVKLKDLAAALPKAARVTPPQRRQQLAERLTEYDLRFADR